MTAFLAFHLASFSVLQVAYACFALGKFELGGRIARLPVLGAYGYAIANVRYYALWPSQVFCPIHYVYFEAEQADGRALALPPFDEHGRAHFGWRDSREVRDAMLLMRATNGLGDLAWRRLFAHVAETDEAWRGEAGRCPRALRAYAIEVWPGPGSFDTDLRAGKRFLRRAELGPATTSNCGVTRLTAAPAETGSTKIPE